MALMFPRVPVVFTLSSFEYENALYQLFINDVIVVIACLSVQ